MYPGRPSPGDADARCITVVHPGETGMPMYLRRLVWGDFDAWCIFIVHTRETEIPRIIISSQPLLLSALVEEKLQEVENCICPTPGSLVIHGSLRSKAFIESRLRQSTN
jgi:hypothetical protein